MFDRIIYSTALTTPAAQGYFENRIFGDGYCDDVSLVSTLRALFNSRIGDSTIHVRFMSLSFAKNDWMGSSAINYVKRSCNEDNALTVASFEYYENEANDFGYSMVEDRFGSLEGWVRLKQITDFFHANFEVMCFVNEQKRSSVLFVKKLNLRKYHQLQVAALNVLPWYFNPGSGNKPTELEMELLRSLQEKTADHYLSVIEKISKEFDFETLFITSKLAGFESIYEKQRLAELEGLVERYHSKIKSLQDEIKNVLRTINDQSDTIVGLRMKIESHDSDNSLTQFFLRNRNFRLDRISGASTLVYHINTYLSYFDSDAFSVFLQDRHSIFYQYAPDTYSHELVERFFKALLVDDEIKMRMCAAYTLDIRSGFNAIEAFNYGADGENRMPNPHIDHYGCLGGYEYRASELMEKNDYISVLEMSVASAANLKATDDAVVRHFIKDIFDGRGGKCFELPDGTLMNITEVMDYFKKEMEEKSNEQAD